MPFSREEAAQILDLLQLPPSQFHLVQTALEKLEQQSEFFVGAVRQIVTDLKANQKNYLEQTGSPNFGIVQADVLSYEVKSKILGILLQSYTLIKKLATYLEITPNIEALEGNFRALGGKLPTAPHYLGKLNRG